VRPLLVLRPEPGASATARRARALGLRPVVAPLFTLRALAWEPPDASAFDAVLFTSANALRHGGPGLARYRHLPAYAVGTATAAAARDAGFNVVVTGSQNAERLVADVGSHLRMLHPCGRHRRDTSRSTHAIPVYSADAAATLPDAAQQAVRANAVAMVHSPRAARLFARLTDAHNRAFADIVAISPAAAQAAGTGWRSIASPPAPTDAAILAIARVLCENDPS